MVRVDRVTLKQRKVDQTLPKSKEWHSFYLQYNMIDFIE